MTPEGQLVSRPLAVQQRGSFDADLWYFTADPSDKTAQVQGNDQVNVAFQTDNGYVSISGTGTVSHAFDSLRAHLGKGCLTRAP